MQNKSFKSLNAQNHFFRASKNTNYVFSATKQMMRMRGHRCSKASFSVRKSCYMKFRHVVFKLSSGGARQILRLISTGGTQSR